MLFIPTSIFYEIYNHCHCELLRSFFIDVATHSVPPTGPLMLRLICISSTEAGDIVCRI